MDFRVGHAFTDSKSPLTSLDFSSRGDLLISTSGDDAVNVYDALQARFAIRPPCAAPRVCSPQAPGMRKD